MTDEVHIGWTGGWDSTFRILEVLACTDYVVQPHYIVEPSRLSVENELRAMDEIRKAMDEWNVGWAERINSIRITHFQEIPEDPRIENAIDKLRAIQHVEGEVQVDCPLCETCRTYRTGGIDYARSNSKDD